MSTPTPIEAYKEAATQELKDYLGSGRHVDFLASALTTAAQALVVAELEWALAGFHSEDALSREEMIDALEQRIAKYQGGTK